MLNARGSSHLDDVDVPDVDVSNDLHGRDLLQRDAVLEGVDLSVFHLHLEEPERSPVVSTGCNSKCL